MTSRFDPPSIGRYLMSAAAVLLVAVLFIACVAYVHAFRPDAAGFEQKGPLLLLYHGCRLGLACFVLMFCYCAGYWALELCRVNPSGLFGSARGTFILCYFLGATLYGIAFTGLGFAGLIGIEAGLALTIPVLLAGHRPLRALLGGVAGGGAQRQFLDTHAGPIFARFVILAAASAAIGFLLTRVVYIPTVENNVWEHYLHYYRSVLASGSTQPNEVWHHFYATKGAGLIFLANVLSDFFGAQLVSAGFVLVAGLIILDLLLEYCRSTSWAYFGVMVFFTFLCGQVADGATFKHHAAILGYMAFALWGCIRLQQASGSQYRPLMAVLVISFAYLGFYQPAMLVLLLPALLLLVVMNAALHDKTHMRSYGLLACGLVAGGVLVFWTNWTLTGLVEVTPMRAFWAIADRAKVAEVFGTGGPEFFFAMNNNLEEVYDWSMRRTWRVLRYPFPLRTVVLLLVVLSVFLILIRKRTRERVGQAAGILAPLAAFILPLSVLVQAVQTAAVDRLALYSIVLTTLAGVVMLKMIVDAWLGSAAWPTIPVRFTVSGKRPFDLHAQIGLWRVASMVIISFGMLLTMAYSWKDIGRPGRGIIYLNVSGAKSLKESMLALESARGGAHEGMLATMSEFRKSNRGDGRLLSLTYAPGFSYSLPGGGIVSEPTYALIRDPARILAAKPGEVADYLRERRIEYFVLDLRSRLFSTIAFSPLFDVREMHRYFSVAHEDGDFFILTWRRDGPESPLPEYLLTVLDLKRAGVLNYPFSEPFAERVSKSDDRSVDSLAGFERVRTEFLQDLDSAFGSEVRPRVSLKTSEEVLDRILGAGKGAVAGAGLEVLSMEKESTLRRTLNHGRDDVRVRLVKEIEERELRELFLKLLRAAIYEASEAEMGGAIAKMFRICDERVPFAGHYPAGASC